MAKKKSIQIGDRVIFNEDKEVCGVVVHKRTDDVLSVHWHNPSRYMRDRGLYEECQITKFNPNNKDDSK